MAKPEWWEEALEKDKHPDLLAALFEERLRRQIVAADSAKGRDDLAAHLLTHLREHFWSTDRDAYWKWLKEVLPSDHG